MAVKKYKPYTPSRRFMIGYDFSELTQKRPEKSLTKTLGPLDLWQEDIRDFIELLTLKDIIK